MSFGSISPSGTCCGATAANSLRRDELRYFELIVAIIVDGQRSGEISLRRSATWHFSLALLTGGRWSTSTTRWYGENGYCSTSLTSAGSPLKIATSALSSIGGARPGAVSCMWSQGLRRWGHRRASRARSLIAAKRARSLRDRAVSCAVS